MAVVKPKKQFHLSDKTCGILFLLPAIAVLCVVVLLPIGKAIYTSFCDYKISNLNNPTWNYFENYRALFESGAFWSYFKTTILYVVISVILQFVVGLGIALLLNANIKGRGIFRGLFVIPWVIPSIVIAILWRLLLNEQFGALNYFLYHLGIFDSVNVSWTMDPKLSMIAIILASMWREIPYMMVMILAGLQSVDAALIEDALIEGANRWQRLVHVILPSITPVLMTSIWIATLGAFQMFNIIYNMTGGGPIDATTTLSIAAYKTAFVSYDFGKGSAIGVLWLLILVIGTVFFNRIKEKNTAEYQ
jgi:multiple sugar transport system permease protein